MHTPLCISFHAQTLNFQLTLYPIVYKVCDGGRDDSVSENGYFGRHLRPLRPLDPMFEMEKRSALHSRTYIHRHMINAREEIVSWDESVSRGGAPGVWLEGYARAQNLSGLASQGNIVDRAHGKSIQSAISVI